MSDRIKGGTSLNAVPDTDAWRGGKNNSGAALSAGDVVYEDMSVMDGISFTTAHATNNLGACWGVLDEAVAIGAYTGKIKYKGWIDALVLGHASMVVGSTLKPVASQKYLTYSAASHTAAEVQPSFIIGVAWTTTSAALKAVRLNLP